MRQTRLLEALGPGARLENETRAWDADARRTRPLRDKETALDFRFMPEPNLPPLRLRRSRSAAAATTPTDYTLYLNSSVQYNVLCIRCEAICCAIGDILSIIS